MVNLEVFTWARWTASSRVASATGRARPPASDILPASGGSRGQRPRRPREAPRKSGVPRDGGTPGETGARGPVVLATLHGAPFAPEAARLAVDLAREGARALVVVDLSSRFAGGRTVGLHIADPAVGAALRAPAEDAAASGLDARVLRVAAARPLDALVDTVADLAPAVLVLGACPSGRRGAGGITPRAYRRAVRRLEARTSCLLWCPGAAPAAGLARGRPVPSHR